MGKNKGFLFAVRHREILMTDLGLSELNSAHLAYRKRSQHSHIVVFSCSVPCFSQLCPISVRSILGLSVESLVTY